MLFPHLSVDIFQWKIIKIHRRRLFLELQQTTTREMFHLNTKIFLLFKLASSCEIMLQVKRVFLVISIQFISDRLLHYKSYDNKCFIDYISRSFCYIKIASENNIKLAK